MTDPGQYPDPPPGRAPAAAHNAGTGPGRRTARRRAAAFALGAAAASALAGLLTGLVWAAVAPRALVIAQGHGTAYVANPETSAFIAADAWFCLLTAAAGLAFGVAGYLLGVRRYGVTALAGLVLGGVAASALAAWAGERQGLAGFRARLAVAASGTRLHQPLVLGGRGPLAFWPMFAALVVGTAEVTLQSLQRRRAEAGASRDASSQVS